MIFVRVAGGNIFDAAYNMYAGMMYIYMYVYDIRPDTPTHLELVYYRGR